MLLFVAVPVSGQLLSDKTGLLYRLDVEAGGHMFEVETISNFDINDYSVDGELKRLTLDIYSGLEGNLGELIIPQDLLGGDLRVYLDDQELHSKIKSNDRISFVTLNFTGSGNHRIDIFADSYLAMSEPIQSEPVQSEPIQSDTSQLENGGGCLIATAAFGSELAPQVQALREIRDGKILTTSIGAEFMTGFNHIYYTFSPHVADYQRENPLFRDAVRIAITPLVISLEVMNIADSENEILIYGVLVMMANAIMYIAVPVAVMYHLRRLITP
ncbi:MAG: peptidylprolyl isomerase [Thaumarchaeota archaeon]|nr:peptidylprolyl isomerase [Nitrososphaerota archaeon]